MILDTSAVIAVVLTEPESPGMEDALEQAGQVSISAATWVELSSVASSLGVWEEADRLLRTYAVRIVPFDAEQAAIAREAQQRFGSGRYRLNLGDTFAYALSKAADEPLLFKGADFARTDVVSALA